MAILFSALGKNVNQGAVNIKLSNPERQACNLSRIPLISLITIHRKSETKRKFRSYYLERCKCCDNHEAINKNPLMFRGDGLEYR